MPQAFPENVVFARLWVMKPVFSKNSNREAISKKLCVQCLWAPCKRTPKTQRKFCVFTWNRCCVNEAWNLIFCWMKENWSWFLDFKVFRLAGVQRGFRHLKHTEVHRLSLKQHKRRSFPPSWRRPPLAAASPKENTQTVTVTTPELSLSGVELDEHWSRGGPEHPAVGAPLKMSHCGRGSLLACRRDAAASVLFLCC